MPALLNGYVSLLFSSSHIAYWTNFTSSPRYGAFSLHNTLPPPASINLKKKMQSIAMTMYADDIVLLFSDKSEVEIEKAVNHDAKMLHNWLCSNGWIWDPKQGKNRVYDVWNSGKNKQDDTSNKNNY